MDSKSYNDKHSNWSSMSFPSIINVLNYRICDYVMKQDHPSRTCTVFAREGNWCGFPGGISTWAYEDFEKFIQTKGRIIGTLEGKRVHSCDEGDRHITDEYNVTYRVSIDGEVHYKRCDTFRNQDDPSCLYNIVYDVTKVIRHEQKISDELKAAVEEAAAANETKIQLLSCLSHDMRTSLGGVLGLTDIAVETESKDEIRAMLKKIRSCAAYTLSMVDDLLDVEKLESNHLQLEPEAVDIRELLSDIEDIIRIKSDEKRIRFTCNHRVQQNVDYLSGDGNRLKQILLNLLTNAVKYTPEGGSVKWEVDCSLAGEKIVLSSTISDNGIGMSRAFQKHMYEAFQRESSGRQNNHESGSGLGLMIAKNLLDLMGGTIECLSEINKGTTFIVHIDFDRPSVEKPAGDSSDFDRKALAGKKVLLCEDSEISAEILMHILKEQGIETEWVKNGLEGLEKGRANTYYAVLTDQEMPGMTGMELSAVLHGEMPDLPIILVSADKMLSVEDHSADFYDILSKPIDAEELIQSLLQCE